MFLFFRLVILLAMPWWFWHIATTYRSTRLALNNNCAQMQVCTKQSATSSSFPHHQSSAVKLGICSILTLRDVTSRSQQSCCICTASRGRRSWLVSLQRYKMLKSSTNQAKQGENKKLGYHQLCQCLFHCTLNWEMGRTAILMPTYI